MRVPEFLSETHRDLLAIAAMNGKNVYENEITKLSNLKIFRNKNNTQSVTINDIFRLYWEPFKKRFKHLLRDSIIKNVESMIACRDLSKGYLFFECPNCPYYHLVGFSCKSRFCSSCGHKYRDERSINIQNKLINVPHRHFVFSVPYDLRPFFWKCRALFDVLFKSVNEAFDRVIKKSRKDIKDDRRVGYVAFLHTSGRSLNMHPHLHVLLAEATIDRFGSKKKQFFFPFEALRKTFMFRFLDNASEAIKKTNDKKLYREFNILRNKIPKIYKHGFYVHGPKLNGKSNNLKNAKDTANYISRYASHPPISEHNILKLNKDDHTVTWRYEPHESPGEVVTITESVFSFIGKLIRHIPDNKTHVLRYYGFYANRASKRLKLEHKLVRVNVIRVLRRNLNWRKMIVSTFKYNPLMCHCGGIMTLNIELSYYGDYERRPGYV